jgi:hypothetical protein
MVKEYVYASRTIEAGEEMMGVVEREAGYFYFVDATGNVLRAKQARRAPLSTQELAKRHAEKLAKEAFREKQRKDREKEKERRKATVEANKLSRAFKKQQKLLAHQQKIKERIASLQSKI